jgi:hypothetical protein
VKRPRPFPTLTGAARRRISTAGAIALGALCLAASAVRSAPLSATGIVSHADGPFGRTTRSAVAVVTASPVPGLSLSAGAMRYDDTVIGAGTGMIGGVGLPLAPLASLRAWGHRYQGDDGFDAWRVKVGPELGLPRGTTLGVYFAHDASDGDQRSNAAIGELALPLAAGLTGRMNAAFASAGADAASTQGALGLGWSPIPRLELSGEIGFARNGWTTAPFPTRRTGGLPLIGGGGTVTEPPRDESATEPTFQLGAAVSFP